MMVPAMVGSWAKCYSWSTVVPLGCVLLGEESWVGEGDGNWFWVLGGGIAVLALDVCDERFGL